MSSGKTYSLSGLRAEPWTNREPFSRWTARPLGQELPALLADRAGLGRVLQLVARPEDGPLGGRVEPVGVEHGPLVVVAEQDELAVHDQVDALARVRAVADDVAQAVDLLDRLLRLDVVQDGLEGFQVAVDVADDGLHAWTLPDWAGSNRTATAARGGRIGGVGLGHFTLRRRKCQVCGRPVTTRPLFP